MSNDIQELKDMIASLQTDVAELKKGRKENNSSISVTLATMLYSKKHLAALAGIIILAARELLPGLENQINMETMVGILTMLGVLITGQGIADIGKEKAKAEKNLSNEN